MKTLHSFLLLWLVTAGPLAAQINPEDVTIVRDSFGVPHIYGKTDADAAYGLAFAMAEDRFDIIQENMALANGRLGELLPVIGTMADYAWNLFRARKLVEDRYQYDVSPEFRKVLEGYCQGINAYAAGHPKEVRLKGIVPITPQDVLTGYVMSMCLMTGVTAHLSNIVEGNAGGQTAQSLRGSNGFAMNSQITPRGEVYLANNSHQPLKGPVAWYEAHINSEQGWNTLGGLFPGGVSIFSGTNENLAWMHTVNMPDLTDVYRLEMNPKDKNSYKLNGEWRKLEVSKAKLKLKVGGLKIPVTKKVYWSEFGPTIKSNKKGRDGNGKGFFAMRFGAIFTIKAAEQWWRMNKAQSFEEFRQVLDMQGLAGLNLVYADKKDNIFYLNNGLFPIRSGDYNWLTCLPGSDSSCIWRKFHPVSSLVQSFNPKCGYVFNTNHSPFLCSGEGCCPDRSQYDPNLGVFDLNNNRSLRFMDLMAAQKGKVNWADFRRIKYDRTYPDSMFVFWLENVEDAFRMDPSKYLDGARAIMAVNAWNREASPESTGAAYFLLAYNYLYRIARKDHAQYERRKYSEAQMAKAFIYSQKYMQKHFHRQNVTLGELQRHVRGKRDEAIGGLPDVISAMYTQKWKKGKFSSYLGDSYIQLIRFKDNKVDIESCVPYGASNHEDSPHFDDQMDNYLHQRTKTMHLEKDEVMKRAERVYHPF
ncbi:MAG: penicillin acylase family protein [Bacteroidia bacterium]|nr:penicillin acylase family protein [Bacteroidia bacterium]